MQHDEGERKNLYTKEELLARIRTALGGRAAEMVFYGEKDGISTGAGGDLASATNVARQLLCSYGMDEGFGLAVFDAQEVRDDSISRKLRDSINQILRQELEQAMRLIRENRGTIDVLVDRLLSDNHITGDEISRIFEEEAGKG